MIVDYRSAGVNRDAANEARKRITNTVESTFSNAVLTPLGHFGALYDLKALFLAYKNPVLVQSTDGVGTKIMIARMMNRYDTIGIDLVSATANDIVALGAKPLTLLNYIGSHQLDPLKIEQLIEGMAFACRAHAIALVGGEMAEMPSIYQSGEHDLVGMITGVVEKEKAVLGDGICVNDRVLAFCSSGLHTNGYSLARHILFDTGRFSVDSYLPALGAGLGEALLEPHINYTQPILHLLQSNIPIKGMCHITGGGVLENIPRILPAGCAVEIKKKTWPESPLFAIIRALGHLDEHVLYRTFNMGIGFILIGDESLYEQATRALTTMPAFKLYDIGRVVAGNRVVRLCE